MRISVPAFVDAASIGASILRCHSARSTPRCSAPLLECPADAPQLDPNQHWRPSSHGGTVAYRLVVVRRPSTSSVTVGCFDSFHAVDDSGVTLIVARLAKLERVQLCRRVSSCEMEANLERRRSDIGEALFAPADSLAERVGRNRRAIFARESRQCLTGFGVD